MLQQLKYQSPRKFNSEVISLEIPKLEQNMISSY